MIRYYIPWKNENSGFLFSEDIKVKHSLKMRQQSFVNLDRVVLVFKHFKNMSQLLLFCQHTFSDKASRKHVNNFRIKPPEFHSVIGKIVPKNIQTYCQQSDNSDTKKLFVT